ncbi:MAG: DUF3299 domain-containing protein [Pseudomonadota bacterium]
MLLRLTRLRIFGLMMTILGLPVAAVSSDVARDVTWLELVDEAAQSFDDPFLSLAPGQIADLVDIVRLQDQLIRDNLRMHEKARLRADIKTVKDSLRTEGVDADFILGQREIVAKRRMQAAWATNSEVEGARISLHGFLLPTRNLDTNMVVAYLVPEFGMCSHVPPPPPNQLVKLGVFDPEELPATPYGFVEVSGIISNVASSDRSMVIDGTVRIHSAWTLTHTELSAPRKDQPKRNRILR